MDRSGRRGTPKSVNNNTATIRVIHTCQWKRVSSDSQPVGHHRKKNTQEVNGHISHDLVCADSSVRLRETPKNLLTVAVMNLAQVLAFVLRFPLLPLFVLSWCQLLALFSLRHLSGL